MSAGAGLAVTQSFTFDFLSNCRAISERSYENKLKHVVWPKFTKVMPSGSSQEIVAWLLNTARIKRNGQGGNIRFNSLAQVKQTYVNGNFYDALELEHNQMTDLDGHGVDLAATWNSACGADIAYFRQRELVTLLLQGESGLCYDGLSYFNASHPVHPLMPGSALYANIFTGGDSGAYPGACPIDPAVTADVALDNLQKIKTYITSVKAPNSVDPRFLTFRNIIHPPALTGRLNQLAKAKFIAQKASGGGAGSGDVDGYIGSLGFGELIEMPEIGAGQSYSTDPVDGIGGNTVSGSDTDFYVLCQEVDQSEVGAMVWVDREPVTVTPFTPFDTPENAKSRKWQWIAQGRGTAGYGLPYFMFKCKAA